VHDRQWTGAFLILPDGQQIALAARAGKSGNEV
jgi:hypothetical protein